MRARAGAGVPLLCAALLVAAPAPGAFADGMPSGCIRPDTDYEWSWTLAASNGTVSSGSTSLVYSNGGVSWTVDITTPATADPPDFGDFVPLSPGDSFGISPSDVTYTWVEGDFLHTSTYHMDPIPICMRWSEDDPPGRITDWDKEHAFERLTERGFTRDQIQNAVDNPVRPPEWRPQDQSWRYYGNDGTIVALNLDGALITAMRG